MATFNMILDPLVYIFFRRENLEWLFRFIRKKRGKSSKQSEESSSASAKTDETNRSATNLEKIQPEFSGAVTTWLTCCIHPNVLSEIQRGFIASTDKLSCHVKLSSVPRNQPRKTCQRAKRTLGQKTGIPGDTWLSKQWHVSPILRVLRPN